MIKYENECVDCGLPCLGKCCPNFYVPRFYCDRCGWEDKLYKFEGEQLCISCIKKELQEVTEEDF